MHPVAARLEQVLEAIRHDATEASTVPLASGLPSPWATWLLLSLIQHVSRQRWVGNIALTQLGVDVNVMSVMGALGHPAIPQSGLVPDLSDWEYYLHGRGCCLTNRITGESIDVDFYEGTADWIDPYFYLGYLKSLKTPELIEQRLIQLHPTLETITLAIDELREAGLLEPHPESKVVKPLEELQSLWDGIDHLDSFAVSPERRSRVLHQLGDWVLTNDEQIGDPELMRRSAECLEQRCRRLEQLFVSGRSERVALMALCDWSPNAHTFLSRALGKPPSGTTSSALEVVFARPEEDWTSQVYDLLSRTNPAGKIPHPHTWVTCAEYLLNCRSHVDHLRKAIVQVGPGCLGDAAILALEYFPELAVELFARALRSTVPVDRNTAAAALAIVDRPWSHALLLNVLKESTDQIATSECRAALSALPHADLHRSVAEWELTNPHEAETGQFISMTEMTLRNRDAWMQCEMEKLHDRVIKLRQLVPPVDSHLN